MLEAMKRALEINRMFEPGDKILVACSGGPDSLALLHGLRRLSLEMGFEIAVAHLEHGFRGEESEAEALFVEEFCRLHGIECVIGRVDMPTLLKEQGFSAQDGARRVRYEFLRRTAVELGAKRIATGHQLDDQAETLLLNLLRGAGMKGLAAMRPVAGDLIRPLLGVKREVIENYCDANELRPRHDSSNEKKCYRRNLLRLEIMPQLRRYNAALPETLARTAELLHEQQQYLQQQALALFQRTARQGEDGLHLEVKALCGEHLALQREIFRLALEKKRGKLTGISFDHVETLIKMLSLPVGSRAELPGKLKVRRTYDSICLENERDPLKQAKSLLPGMNLEIPGFYRFEELGFDLKIETGFFPKAQDEISFVIKRSAISGGLLLRTRLPGDRFRPKGMNGSKKLKDFFIDIKLPRELRDSVPLLCDAVGILWIAGVRAAERNEGSDKEEEQVRISIHRKQEEIKCIMM